MPIDVNITSVVDSVGTFGLNCSDQDINFSEIFTGTPQFYAGSIIQVQELLDIRTFVDNELLVSVSNAWFGGSMRLGTYRIARQLNSLDAVREGEFGYIPYTWFQISRISNYTITANPGTPIAINQQLTIDNCNAYLTPEAFFFPPNPVAIPGFKYQNPNKMFTGDITLARAPLANTVFSQRMKSLGIVLSPGVRCVGARYRVSVINDIYTAYDPYLPPICSLPGNNCEQQFQQFLDNPGNFAYRDQATCEAVPPGGACIPRTFVCSGNPSITFPYWMLNVN